MKRVILSLSIVLSTLLSGCSADMLPERTEINELNMIRAVGVDKGTGDSNNVCVTIVSEKSEEGQNGQGDSKTEKAVILSNEAPTLLQAQRAFQTYSDKRMFWGHAELFLVSEEAAKEGIAKYIDFFARDYSFRDTAKIYIIKGSTAADFIKRSSANNYFMPDHLRAIGKNSKFFTGSQELELLEFMQWLNDAYSSAIVPVLYLKEKENENSEENKEDEPVMDIELEGYAIFKGSRLATIIDRTQARGENFLLNRVVTGVIQVKDPNGKMVGLDIIDNNTKIAPIFKDGELQSMSVKVSLSSNVDEMHSSIDIFDENTLNFLSAEQSKVIKSEIEQVIKIAQQNNIDFIDMANVFSTKHPVRWERHKDRWEEIFPSLSFSVEVESKINRTYDIREPNDLLSEGAQMIFVYLATAVGISIYDILYLQKKRLKRDITAHVCCMVLASAIGVIYLNDTNQKSIAGYVFEVLKIRG